MKSRVASGAALVVFLLAIVIFNRSFPMALNLAISLISVMGVVEIISALGMSKNSILLLPSAVFAAVLPLVQDPVWQQAVYYIYTVILFVSLIFYHQMFTFREIGVVYSMTLLIPTALETLVGLRSMGHNHGMFYVIIAIFSAWIADVGAFFAGSFLGKHKLCPQISPKKTVEGLVGGFVLDIAAMLVFGYIFHAIFYAYQVQISYFSLFVIGLVGAALSVIGDLSFSLIKRSCHIKDFGEVIPGHGGILDRFDSVIFVAPFVYFWVQFFPIVVI